MWRSNAVRLWRAVLTGTAILCLSAATAPAQEEPAAAAAAAPQSSCLVCHSNLGGQLAAPTQPFPTDIHAEKGLTCASCHGGDPSSMDMQVAMSPAKGFRGKPSRRNVPEFCGRCHNDTAYMHRFNPTVQTGQVAQYYTSRHGQRLQQGDQRVATCINCHSVHDTKLVSDPTSPVYPLNIPDTCGKCHSNEEYMKGYELPGLTQVADYKKSVHYQALTVQGNLSAPTCVTCHSSHGATPPGTRSVADVCGTCHAHNRELFEASPHRAAFAALGAPGCVQCHSNHAIERSNEQMLAGPGSMCLGCHAPGDAGAQRAQAMADRIRELDTRIQQAQETLDQADQAGMDVSSAMAELTTAHSHLVMSRTAIHSLDEAQVTAEVNQGLPIADQVREDGRGKLAEVQSRRKGVGLFSLLVLAVVFSLYLYIRENGSSRNTTS